MRNSDSKGKLSGFFKIVGDKLKGKEHVKKIDISKMSEKDFCEKVLLELGGIENLNLIDSCLTRLRIQVKSLEKINNERLEALGSEGTIDVGNNTVQIIFGENSAILEKYYNNLKKGNTEK